MIRETKFWVAELKGNIEFIHACIQRTDLSLDELAELEKRLMVSCYVVRKMVESNKIKKEDYHSEICLCFYERSDKGVPSAPVLSENNFYRDKPIEIAKPFSFVLNQLIHSYNFEFLEAFDGRISSFCFNSDRSSKGGIYLVDIEDFFNTLTSVVEIYVGKVVAFIKDNRGWRLRWD